MIIDGYYIITDTLLRLGLLTTGFFLGAFYYMGYTKRTKEEVKNGSVREDDGELVLRLTEKGDRQVRESTKYPTVPEVKEDKPEGVRQEVQYPQKQYRGLVTVEQVKKRGIREIFKSRVQRKGHLPPAAKQQEKNPPADIPAGNAT